MRRILSYTAIFILFAMYGNADDIDFELQSGLLLKMLRDMANKTNASESLNLPANSTSIRENITDTFSCENRTYGYYADVDNECQIFHVCLPSQTPSGRNVTYRWSFICPGETVFNQEVLVCTRPIDSIPCEESPSFYDLNNEIGKVPPKNDSRRNNENKIKFQANEIDRNQIQHNDERDRNHRNQIQKKRQDYKKQNIIVDTLFKEIVDEELKEKLQDVELGDNVEEIFPELITDENPEEIQPDATYNKEEIAMTDDDMTDKLALETSVGEINSRKRRFRYRADI